VASRAEISASGWETRPSSSETSTGLRDVGGNVRQEATAKAFYAKCGFREVGRVIYRKTPLVYFDLLL
jgi:hypothetical protein